MVMPIRRTAGQVQAIKDVAVVLRSCRDDVGQRWRELVRTSMGLADEQAEQLLGGSVGKVLETVAKVLETGLGEAASRDEEALKGAAGDDVGPASFEQMTAGYCLLRQAIMEQVARALGRKCRGEEMIGLCGAVDGAMISRLAAAVEKPVRELRDEAEIQTCLLSVLLHDLRGTLNGIVLMMEVLRRDLQGYPEHAENLEDLKLVRQSIQEMADLLERHALLYRLQRGKVHVQKERIALRELAEAEGFAEAARKKGIELVIEIPVEASVEADRMLLATSMRELTDNAVKHASAGRVRLTASKNERGMWVLSISDSGPGIPRERLEMLLDPRQRLANRERGFGLMIVQYAGRLFGARLEAESEVGEGTTFRLALLGG